MRCLLLFLLLFYTAFMKAQIFSSLYFIGRDLMFTNAINAHGVLVVDSNLTGVDLENVNYYGIKELNAYKISIGHLKPKIGYKLSYSIFKENVFSKHRIRIGIQKQLSTNLFANSILGIHIREYNENITTGFVYGMALRFLMNTKISIHHQWINGLLFKESQLALKYQWSKSYAVLAQLDYNNTFEGRLGMVLNIYKLKVQISHRFVHSSLGLGLGYTYSCFNFNVNYNYHDILGGLGFVKIQIAL